MRIVKLVWLGESGSVRISAVFCCTLANRFIIPLMLRILFRKHCLSFGGEIRVVFPSYPMFIRRFVPVRLT